MGHKKIFLTMSCLVVYLCSIAENTHVPLGKSTTTIKLKNDNDKALIFFRNVDLGPFGASQLSLGIKSTVDTKSISKKLSIHFDNGKNTHAKLEFDKIFTDKYNYVVTFNITTPNGVHDVFVSIPSDMKSSDVDFIQFHKEDLGLGNFYYLVSKESGKALTACSNHGKVYACVNTLQGLKPQKFQFVEVFGGGYKIVTIFDNQVLSVKDGSVNDFAEIIAEPFTNLPNQVWFVQEIDEGFRLRPKHFYSKCFDLKQANHDDGTIIISHVCNSSKAQTWFFVRAL